MTDSKDIVCDACGRHHLCDRFHLHPNLDLCLTCADELYDDKLSIDKMRKFVRATRKMMCFTQANEDGYDVHTAPSSLKRQTGER